MKDYTVTHLKHLESEAIYVLRETSAQFENPALAFLWRQGLHSDDIPCQKSILARKDTLSLLYTLIQVTTLWRP